MTINGYVIINGTMTVDFGGANGYIRIPAGDTLYVTNLTFTNVNPAQEKVLDVDGVLIVTGVLDFSDDTIEINGGGSISAGSIVGGSNTGCSTETPADCPNPFSAGSCTGGGLCNEGSLPVQLIDFSATVSGTQVVIKWSSSSELNLDYFKVERSRDGKKFKEIARVNGEGNSFEQKNYSFSDISPMNGRSYYRLTSVDFDNTSEVFNAVMVNFSGENSATIYPNPVVGGKAKLILNFTPSEEYSVVISNLAGVRKYKFTSSNPELSMDFPSGTYIVNIYSNEFNKAIRLFVP